MADDKFKVGVLTVSDKGAAGEREDKSGAAIAEMVSAVGWEVVRRDVVPDNHDEIKDKLIAWCDLDRLDLVITTGGTGFSPRDVTPEATLAAIERATPGISEAMRAAGLEKTPKAMLSRGVSGIRGATLIVNVPGSEKAARESLTAIVEILPHGIEVLGGGSGDCGG